MLQQRFRKIIEVKKWIVAQLRLAFSGAHPIIQRYIQPHLGIGKRRNKDWNILLICRFQNSASFGVVLQVVAYCAVQLPRTHNLLRVPLAQHFFHHQFNMVQVLLRLQCVIDAVIARLIQLNVVHSGVIAIVLAAGGFD